MCNPCNIRISTDKFLGEVQPSSDKAFKEFERNAYGYRAAFRVLLTYITRYHVNTMRGMIARFAPATENHTEAYVNTVAQRAAIDPDKDVTIEYYSEATEVTAEQAAEEGAGNG